MSRLNGAGHPAVPSMRAFPYIVGCGRSGSTLLASMLGMHHSLALPRESYFITELHPTFSTWGRGSIAALCRELAEHRSFRGWDADHESLLQELEDSAPSSYSEAIRTLLQIYANRLGKEAFAHKAPSHVHHLGELSILFPEAKFIHLVRDGRDVALSFLQVRAPWAPPDFFSAVRRWRKAVDAGCAAGRLLGPSRYLEVRYEELVRAPRETLTHVCEFVGLEFEPGMLEYHRHIATPGPWHTSLALPPTPGLRDWRREMSMAQKVAFEALAGRLRRDLGYPPSLPSPRPMTAVRVRCRLGAWHVRRRASLLKKRITRRSRRCRSGAR